MNRRNRIERVGEIAQLLAGLEKHGAKTGALVVNGETRKPRDIAASLRRVLDAAARVAELRGSLKAALDEEQRIVEAERDVVAALKAMTLCGFDNKADVLADFGLRRPTRRRRTVAEKVETVQKQLATREARQTMGPRQKERVHGTPPAGNRAVAPGPSGPNAVNATPTNGAASEQVAFGAGPPWRSPARAAPS